MIVFADTNGWVYVRTLGGIKTSFAYSNTTYSNTTLIKKYLDERGLTYQSTYMPEEHIRITNLDDNQLYKHDMMQDGFEI